MDRMNGNVIELGFRKECKLRPAKLPGVLLPLSSPLLRVGSRSSFLSADLSPPQPRQGSQGRGLPHRCSVCKLQSQTHNEDDLILPGSQLKISRKENFTGCQALALKSVYLRYRHSCQRSIPASTKKEVTENLIKQAFMETVRTANSGDKDSGRNLTLGKTKRSRVIKVKVQELSLKSSQQNT